MADGLFPIIVFGPGGWKTPAPTPLQTTKMQTAPFLVVITYESGQTSIERCETLETVSDLKQRALTGMTSMMSVDVFVRIG